MNRNQLLQSNHLNVISRVKGMYFNNITKESYRTGNLAVSKNMSTTTFYYKDVPVAYIKGADFYITLPYEHKSAILNFLNVLIWRLTKDAPILTYNNNKLSINYNNNTKFPLTKITGDYCVGPILPVLLLGDPNENAR